MKTRRLPILVLTLLLAALPPLAAPLEAQTIDPAFFSELRWRVIGPFRGGRTVAVCGVPGKPTVFYMAPNNGGVWKTDDAGRTWNPIFDDQPTGSIGAIALAPSDSNVIYVGSGEGLQRPDLSVGDGVYKSTDGGKTWTNMGLSDGRQIAAISVDPGDANRVFAAVLGHPYGPNPERGIFRSSDGGKSWQRVLYKDEDTGGIDLALDPANSKHVYAVLWSARQGPWEYGNGYTGSGSGLFHSTDGGTTWRPLTKGFPTPEQGLGRIGIAVSPSDPKRLYALVDAEKLGGLYRSDDSGESWERTNSDNRLWGRGSDFAEARVDPGNRDVVWVANIALYKSTDGGKSFTAIKGAPGGDDYHRIWLSPENPDVILLGVDQGATLSVNGGRTWSSWYNQPTAQMFHVSTDSRFPYRVYGGQQESGSAAVWSRGNDGAITFREFHPVGADEYGYVAPDPLHPGVIYGSKGTRYDETTGQTRQIGPVALRTGAHRFDRTAPILFSPTDPRVLFFAAEVLWKTTDGGETWDQLSGDLTREKPGVPANLGRMADKDPQRDRHRGVIYSIGPSPEDVNLIWVGTDDGLVHVTPDGGKTWGNVTPSELTPWSKVTQIDAGHFDKATAYISVSRFRLDDLRPYIYRTHDSGKSWQKIVQGLPENASVNVVREDPVRKGLLFAGTERQVWVSFDDGDHWQSLRLNMPATSVRDLVVHEDDVAVGTHGRSFWILDDITPLRQLDARVAASPAFLFRPQLARRVRWNTNTDTPLPPEEPAGENPPDGAILDYWLKTAVSGPVTLEILDSANRLVRRFASTDKPEPVDPVELAIATDWIRPPRILSAAKSSHRFVWDLHHPPPDALDREYPIAATWRDTPREPRGRWALPGDYTVKLAVGGKTYTQPLKIEMDPRVKTPAADLARQFELAARITAAMHEDFQALAQVKSLRAQLKALRERGGQGISADAIDALEKKASALAQSAPRFAAGSPDESAPPSLARLNRWLASLLETIDGADAKPTAQAAAAVEEVEKTLSQQLGSWQEIVAKDVPRLNEQLRSANLTELKIETGAPPR
jgi:photosystem II stability/assembly factor-like uncharacterized protein